MLGDDRERSSAHARTFFLLILNIVLGGGEVRGELGERGKLVLAGRVEL